jgi:hypothetical protein
MRKDPTPIYGRCERNGCVNQGNILFYEAEQKWCCEPCTEELSRLENDDASDANRQ